MSRLPLVLGVLAVLVGVEGLVAARIGFAQFAFQSAVLSLASGWVTAASGLVAWNLAPASRIGPLLVLAGATSFLGAFAAVGWAPVAILATRLTWLQVAVLGHAVLTHPDGRARTATTATLISVGYIVVLLSPADDPSFVAIWLAGAVVLRRVLDGRDPRRGSADLAGFVAAGGLAGGTLLSIAAPSVPLNGSALRYAALAAAAMLLASDVLRRTPARSGVTDAVLRLDPSAPVSVVAELRSATGDPSLEVGVRLADGAGFVDLTGRPLVVPASGSGRTVTSIAWRGEAGAVVVHDVRLDTPAALSTASTRAIELAAANARLQAELRDQVLDVRASRRRIVEAGAAARSALEHRIATGLMPRLGGLERSLEGLPASPGNAGGDVVDGVRRALAEIREELARLADGLHPNALEAGGLSGALERLAGRCPVPVHVSAASLPPLPAAVASTARFVSSEALTNVAKHARASHAVIAATVEGGCLTVEVTDDGVGGADPEGGTGLRGLRDRVEALGGTLGLESENGSGTRLWAELPLAAS